jgi:aryl-alcohol dehydrogenase-like predicted oxidoreductase
MFWDTANRYNNSSGNSERILGRWFAANPRERRNVELATKIYGLMDGTTPNFCRLSRVNIMEAVYASLERLRTDRVEILQFHEPDPSTPVEESLLAVRPDRPGSGSVLGVSTSTLMTSPNTKS